jgi:ATP-dependent RNA circularization protein (DNA/RNA ligase family)
MPDSPDKAFGIAGQALGLRVREPTFEEGEEVRWEARANRFQQKFRSIGGRVYLTDRRLVFAPNKFEQKIGGRTWSARLSDLDRAFVRGLLKNVRVVANDGAMQRFVIWPRVESAATIDAAIQAAKASADSAKG